MRTRRIHVMGASGAGVTTLGRALADALSAPHHDSDDYFWAPSNPPYRERRDVAERQRLMWAMFVPRNDWVLSGSCEQWAGEIVALFDLVVFLRTATALRLERLWDREVRRYGAEALHPGSPERAESDAFIEWASHYEDGTREGRHLARHLSWLKTLRCPVLEVDGARPVAELVDEVLAMIRAPILAGQAASGFRLASSAGTP